MSDADEEELHVEATDCQEGTSRQNESSSSECRRTSRKPEEKKRQQKGSKNLYQVKSPKILKVIVNHLKGPARMKDCKCSQCGKSFQDKSALLKHLNSHAEGRPYECVTCEKNFSKRSSLVIHQQTHTERKVFTCKECGKMFARESNLSIHSKTHLEKKAEHKKSTRHTKQEEKPKEKPYKCLECKKMFVLHKNFMKHLTSHVRVMPPSSETAHVKEQLSQAEKQGVSCSSKVEKQAVDRSELILEELTRMRENVDMLLLNQQCQLQVLQEIQKQLGILLPGNDLLNSNVYSLGLLLGQQALAAGSPLPVLLNPSNLLPESARPLSSRIPS
ncbi:zinc finger protein 37 homolog [Heteronotia binoei]|uniref:zinc finger protein 37 homolog n=1 Tax=Heteronotia binoei TaxID=13085 RepID=UPI0029312971|nr:zinc finger protein 37 homolog [Heteronotia binoei]XP_060110403.1 zinc finger protein 37 homolog [Heteronotia binoei]